ASTATAHAQRAGRPTSPCTGSITSAASRSIQQMVQSSQGSGKNSELISQRRGVHSRLTVECHRCTDGGIQILVRNPIRLVGDVGDQERCLELTAPYMGPVQAKSESTV